jgi:outer membrane protein
MINRFLSLSRLSRSFIFLPIIPWLAVFGVSAQPQDSLPIDKAVEIVLKRHPSVAQAQEALAAAKAHTQGLKSAYYPSANAAASYTNIGPKQEISIPIPNIPQTSFSLFPENNYDVHLGAEYTVYDFGKRSTAVKSGKAAEAISADNLDKTKLALSFQTVQVFNVIVFTEKSITVADEGHASLDRHLAIVKKKLETGSATDYDVLKTQVQRSSAQSQRIDLLNSLARNQAVLRQLLGLPPDAHLCLIGRFTALSVILTVDSLVRVALDNRSERRLALHNKESARLARESAKVENFPVIGVRAAAGFKNGILPDINEPRFNWSAGAQVSVPLFDGMRSRNREKEAGYSENAAGNALGDAEERIVADVLSAKADVDAAFAKLDISTTQVTFAQQTLALARLKYAAGVITNHDVLDAENDFSQAQLGDLQNRFKYVMSLYALDQATGKFTSGR